MSERYPVILPSQADELRYDYSVAKMRTADILEKYHCGYPVLYNTLKRFGIEKRGFRLTNSNYQFFDNWSTQMAWVLGLWITDGSIGHIGQCYSITIGFSDHDLLYRVHELLESTKAIWFSQPKHFWQFSICGHELYDRLVTLGLTERKTNRIVLPDCPNIYLSHLVRGIFDGDGSIYTVKLRSGKENCAMSFVSASEAFITNLALVISQNLGITSIPHKVSNSQCWSLRYAHRASVKLGTWMYQDSETIRYNTKYQKFLRFVS
jgi:hypothetical protein